MTTPDITHYFNVSFYEASGHLSTDLFSSTIRWLAIVLVILATMWSINHFMSMESRAHDTYLVDFGTRIVKLVIGLTFFILLLTTQGK
jgi:hypothetical protein